MRFFKSGWFLPTLFLSAFAWSAEPARISFEHFQNVVLIRPTHLINSVVLFLSGEHGWDSQAQSMAEALSSEDALVIGIDGPSYLRAIEKSPGSCLTLSPDLDRLSHFVQKSEKISDYKSPYLVGFSSGATLAYIAAAQAPDALFSGTISLSFCADLKSAKPFCNGHGLVTSPLGDDKYRLHPAKGLHSPWVALHGTSDKVSPASTIEAYVKDVPDGDLVLLPNVGHDLGDRMTRLPPLKETFVRISKQPGADRMPVADSIKDLPLIEIPSKTDAHPQLLVLISGDGGWASIDRQLTKSFVNAGFSVVGLNSLKYFWKRRTPDETSHDLERILRFYLPAWKKKSAVVVGYSRGADVMPFMINRLPTDVRNQIALMAMLGLESSVDFEIHPGDVFNMRWKGALPVMPELDKITGTKMLCVYGSDEKDTLCKQLRPDVAEAFELSGGHHFGGDYSAIARKILEKLK